jgi:hypothetical protein
MTFAHMPDDHMLNSAYPTIDLNVNSATSSVSLPTAQWVRGVPCRDAATAPSTAHHHCTQRTGMGGHPLVTPPCQSCASARAECHNADVHTAPTRNDKTSTMHIDDGWLGMSYLSLLLE